MLVANIKIWKSHLNIREGSDYKISFSFDGEHREILKFLVVKKKTNFIKAQDFS